MTAETQTPAELPALLPASPVVALHLQRLPEQAELSDRSVLDVGCGNGRNSIQMALRGYAEVLGIDTDEAALQQANKWRQENLAQLHKATVGKKVGDRCLRFANVDITDLNTIEDSFSVVMANEVLHQLPKAVHTDTVRSMQERTRRGGLNLLSGYVLSKEVRNPLNKERMLQPGQLRRYYETAGWQVEFYREILKPVQQVADKEYVFSQAHLIARKRY